MTIQELYSLLVNNTDINTNILDTNKYRTVHGEIITQVSYCGCNHYTYMVKDNTFWFDCDGSKGIIVL